MIRRLSTWTAVALVLSAHVQAHALAETELNGTTAQMADSAASFMPMPGQFYQVKQSFEAAPVGIEGNDGSIANVTGQTIEFNVGDGFQVVATAKTADGHTLVRVVADRDWGSDAWFNLADLPRGTVEAIDPSEIQVPDTNGMDDDEIYAMMNGIGERYDETLEARNSPRRSSRGSRRGSTGSVAHHVAKGGSIKCAAHPNALGCCYSAVKNRLQQMGLVDHRLEGVAARSAAAQLPSSFKEVGCASRTTKPRVGEVCTFTGGTYGHVEIYSKCDNGGYGWYYGAHCGTPMSSPARRCFSCKVKLNI